MFEVRIAIAAFSVSVGLIAHAQSPPASGMYQITSGRYIACCGFAGPFSENLPNAAQRFVELTVHPATSRADMRILAEDMGTVLGVSNGSDSFIYAFSNGVVLPDRIVFEDPLPSPGRTRFRYTVSNSVDLLRIDGSVDLPPVCCDIFTQFSHSNTVAVLTTNTNTDQTPPVIRASAKPNKLWPPNGKLVPVVISGTITDAGSGVDPATALFCVRDEYRRIESAGRIVLGQGGAFSLTLHLQAQRSGGDQNGRQYLVRLGGADRMGNASQVTVSVVVPHSRAKSSPVKRQT